MAPVSPPQWNTPFLSGSAPSKPWQQWLQQLFNRLTASGIVTSGPIASRPTNLRTEDANTWYFSTDTGVLKVWNGTAWVP